MWTGGVDFGGTNIKVGLVARGRVVAQTTLSTRAHASPARFVAGLQGALEGLMATVKIRRSQLRGIGIGVPGILDTRRGVLYELPNVPGRWRGVKLRQLVEARLRRPCVVDNDANAVALGEWRCGAGRGSEHGLYVTVGTGVGGALVLGGRFFRGAAGSAGEIGHTVILQGGRRCVCGVRGCLEAYISTTSILREARAAIRRGSRILRQITEQHRGRLTPELVHVAARRGDRAARVIWRDVGHSLGVGLASAVNLLSPERIVIGGGIAAAWPFFIGEVRSTIRARAFDRPARACRIVRAQLGERAGIIGAAMLVWEQARQKT